MGFGFWSLRFNSCRPAPFGGVGTKLVSTSVEFDDIETDHLAKIKIQSTKYKGPKSKRPTNQCHP